MYRLTIRIRSEDTIRPIRIHYSEHYSSPKRIRSQYLVLYIAIVVLTPNQRHRPHRFDVTNTAQNPFQNCTLFARRYCTWRKAHCSDRPFRLTAAVRTEVEARSIFTVESKLPLGWRVVGRRKVAMPLRQSVTVNHHGRCGITALCCTDKLWYDNNGK